jgi:hypothetical protein
MGAGTISDATSLGSLIWPDYYQYEYDFITGNYGTQDHWISAQSWSSYAGARAAGKYSLTTAGTGFAPKKLDVVISTVDVH